MIIFVDFDRDNNSIHSHYTPTNQPNKKPNQLAKPITNPDPDKATAKEGTKKELASTIQSKMGGSVGRWRGNRSQQA